MRVQLILDAASVASTEGASFHLNPAVKHVANPVLHPGLPHQWDGLNIGWPATVLYSASDGKFRCWYTGREVMQSSARAYYTGYAESDDGINWVKPHLGQVRFLDAPTNQIRPAWTVPDGWTVMALSLAFENPLPDAPASQRFGGYWIEYALDFSHWTKCLAWSPDGKIWTRHSTAYEKRRRVEYQDICQLLYDPDEPDPAWRVKGYTQLYQNTPHPLGDPHVKFGVRHAGLVHGASFERVTDAAQPVALAPLPGVDEEIHLVTVTKLHGQYLMLFESDRFSREPLHGDLRLAVSDDGRTFRRVNPEQAVVATGRRGTWDENLLVTTSLGLQPVGDDVYIYYVGCPSTFTCWPMQYTRYPERRGSEFAPTFLGLATLRRDRYAYAAGPGQLVLKLPAARWDHLWLNADGAPLISCQLNGRSQTGRLGSEVRHGVYRQVQWEVPPRDGTSVHIILNSSDRLYSYAWE